MSTIQKNILKKAIEDLHGLDRRICYFYKEGCYEKLLRIADQYGLRVRDE